ncbi:MAG: electron transport complex subunit RsxE [Tenericutes bacterium HGW-Tenericutes-1]|jgi:electron transport complex protein RnfE|nr:MAG: electron transport complex subunit RsxE [Tenericutes bacterium HGW-Tenericutes-1]
MNQKQNFFKGIIKENPLFVTILGTCPSLAITTSLENAIGMGIAVFFVLVLSNLIISLITVNPKMKELVKPVRIPVYIVVIATLVTIVEMVLHAFLVDLYNSLGVFIPLIVVNCIILGRAEAFASDNKPLDSVVDGMGMAVGYTLALMSISFFRELLGRGLITIWGEKSVNPIQLNLVPIFEFIGIEPINMFLQPVGAFLTFGFILAVLAAIANKKSAKMASEVKQA